MHEHNYYDPEDADHKIMGLIDRLRKNTEIETCEAKDYNLLKQRLLERVAVLARELLAKHLLERHSSGRMQKTPCFRDYWQHRQSSWGYGTPSPKKTHPKRASVYDFEMPTDEEVIPSSSPVGKAAHRLPSKVRLKCGPKKAFVVNRF